MLEDLNRGNKVPLCAVIRILNRKPRLVVPGKTVFPFSSLGPIKHKRFRIRVYVPCLEYDWQNFNLDAKINLYAHTLRPKPHLVAVSTIREQRRGNNAKDFIPAIRFPRTTGSSRIPQIAKHNDIDIVDGINCSLLLIRTLKKCNRCQFSRR